MRLIVLSAILAAVAFTQEAPKLPTNTETMRVIELKYADPNEIRGLLQAFPVSISQVSNLKMLAIRGPKETVDIVEQALKKIDVPVVPRKNIEFLGYMISASPKAFETTEPADLAAVVKQLRAIFPYKSYRVVETFFLRTRDGQRASASGFITVDPTSSRPYNFDMRPTVTGEKGLRLDNLQLTIRSGPTGPNYGFNTDLDIREGQKVVVGKSNVIGSDEALILVLSAKILE